MTIGELIKQYRIAKTYSVNKLANMAGISQSFLRDIELGAKNPSIETLSYICDALNISLADFFNAYCKQESTIDSLTSEICRLTPRQRELLESFLHSMLDNEPQAPTKH